jgi:DNA repair exonuclease SbcCD nuclease subunit
VSWILASVTSRRSTTGVLRLLHTADVHLGARHGDLGDQAFAQRERQFAAFRASVELALSEKVDLFLIAGDLFDSNTQPKRTVEQVAAELARLADAKIRTVIIPGTHDVYDRASIYRAYDLPAMAGMAAGDDRVTVLTPDRTSIHLPACDALVFGLVFPTKRAPHSPLRDFSAVADTRATWKIGLIHGALAIPGRTDTDEVVFTKEEAAASGLDYLALGHWHSAQTGKAGTITYAYPGAPEPVAVDQDRAGKVLLVTLDERAGKKTASIEERQVGRTRFERIELDAAAIGTQPELIGRLSARADPNLVLDVELVGVRPDEIDLDTEQVESELRGSFHKIRVRDTSAPALTSGPLPPPDTIVGAFFRDLEGQIAELEAAGRPEALSQAAELRDQLRLGRLLLAGHEVTL